MARVLLVDDDPDQLEMRRMLFQQAGHEVYTAMDAGTALELFGRAAPQLVVTDLCLPKAEDGLALIRAMRQRASGVRIVVLSGWTADLEHLPETGLVDAIIGKPARTSGLLAIAAKLNVWMFAALLCFAPCASAAGHGAPLLPYTVLFTNEEGGTYAGGLMAPSKVGPLPEAGKMVEFPVR